MFGFYWLRWFSQSSGLLFLELLLFCIWYFGTRFCFRRDRCSWDASLQSKVLQLGKLRPPTGLAELWTLLSVCTAQYIAACSTHPIHHLDIILYKLETNAPLPYRRENASYVTKLSNWLHLSPVADQSGPSQRWLLVICYLSASLQSGIPLALWPSW